MYFKLFDTYARQRESYLKVVAILLNHFEQRIERRHIRTFCDVRNETLVLIIVVIVVIGTDIKETVALQLDILMYLEV